MSQGFQFVCSAAPTGQKIYFKNNRVDTVQFRIDLRYFNELNKGNYDTLLIEAFNLRNQSKRINFDWGLFIANFELSFAHLKMGDIDSSMFYANRTMKLALDNNEPEWIANAHKRIGSCFEANSNFEKAIFHYIECEKIARAIKLNNLVIDIVNSKGIIYRQMKDFKTALDHFNSILKDFNKSLSHFDLFRVTNNIGNVYFDQERYDKAQRYFLEAKDHAYENGDSLLIALINQNLGNVLYKQKQYEEAEIYIQKAIHYFEKVNDKVSLEKLLRTMGCIKSITKKFALAEDYYDQSLRIAMRLNNKRLQLINYHNLGSNFFEWGKQEPKRIDIAVKENACLRYELELKDTLSQMENIEKIHELEKKYETEKKNNQISLLEKETEVQQNRQMIMFIGMIVLVLLIGVLVVAFQFVRKTNSTLTTKNKRIESQSQQINEQNQQLEISVNTQNKLFSIIAHDLRSPLASISNISVLLQMAYENKDMQLVEELVSKLGQRNSQVLQLTDNLLNWASSQTGKIKLHFLNYELRTIIQEAMGVFEEVMIQKNIKLAMNIPNGIAIFIDSITIKTVFRNLINNAIKFTKQGGEITIGHQIEDNNVIVKISDNGIGIPENIKSIIFDITDKKQQVGTMGEKSSGLGLVVCKEFVEQNNGSIWLTSIEGKGTNLFVSLPLYQG